MNQLCFTTGNLQCCCLNVLFGARQPYFILVSRISAALFLGRLLVPLNTKPWESLLHVCLGAQRDDCSKTSSDPRGGSTSLDSHIAENKA